MTNDKSKYNFTAEQVAKEYDIDSQTVKNWAKNGYPLRNGNKIKLEGYQYVGRQLRFNINVIKNFIDRINEELWEYSKGHTKQKTVKTKQARTGTVNSTLMVSDSARQLELLINRKHKKFA